MAAHAEAVWNGDLPTGSGTFSAGDSITGGYTFKSRFEGGAGSNPEQLIGAAHASCFSMALAHGLSEAGHAPEWVRTEASVTLAAGGGGFAISRIDLVTQGKVASIDAATFAEFAEQAKLNCPVSKALAGVPEITLSATLAD